jgi:hypothetical protein
MRLRPPLSPQQSINFCAEYPFDTQQQDSKEKKEAFPSLQSAHLKRKIGWLCKRCFCVGLTCYLDTNLKGRRWARGWDVFGRAERANEFNGFQNCVIIRFC